MIFKGFILILHDLYLKFESLVTGIGLFLDLDWPLPSKIKGFVSIIHDLYLKFEYLVTGVGFFLDLETFTSD